MVIYYNDKPVFIIKGNEIKDFPEDALVVEAEKERVRTALDVLNHSVASLYITGKSEEEILAIIKSITHYIPAAGGIVKKKDRILLIKRNGKWDLPKGKLEVDESIEEGAKREIEEECNVKVKIVSPLMKTYHFYDHKGQRVFKETFWYSADLLSDGAAAPQTEEGITEIRWMSESDLNEIFSNTYRNIVDVLTTYFNSDSGN